MTARKKLEALIATVKDRIVSYDYTLEQSIAASTRFSEVLNGDVTKLTEEEKAELRLIMEECGDKLGLVNDIRYLAELEKTASYQLIESPADRIIVPPGKKLVSPAGFHPDENVFVIVTA